MILARVLDTAGSRLIRHEVLPDVPASRDLPSRSCWASCGRRLAVSEANVGQDPTEPARHIPGGRSRETKQHRHEQQANQGRRPATLRCPGSLHLLGRQGPREGEGEPGAHPAAPRRRRIDRPSCTRGSQRHEATPHQPPHISPRPREPFRWIPRYLRILRSPADPYTAETARSSDQLVSVKSDRWPDSFLATTQEKA